MGDTNAPNGSSSQSKYASHPNRKGFVTTDSQHPFDLDAYISQYSGRTAISRLRYIAEESDQLAPIALQTAVQLVLQTTDVGLYQKLLNDYNLRRSSNDLIPLDSEWVERTKAANTRERDRLETEVKTYTSNMIKESIRMGHRELGDYHWSTGDYTLALKHHNKSREFCSNSAQILDYSLTVLRLLIENCDYSHVGTYVFKAESAFAPENTKEANKKAAPPAGSAAAAAAASSAANPDKEKAQAKIDYSYAVSQMASGNYEKAAFAFAKLNRSLEDWFGSVVAPTDVAIYGTLCAIAALPRSSVKVNYHENDAFAYFLEQEPHTRELLDAFMNGKFQVVLSLLEKYSTRHLLDIHLGRHVVALTSEIRKRSIVLYFQPFSSVQLEKMSSAFGIPVSQMESLVIQLIQEGRIQARVDSKNKILVVQQSDPRFTLYKRAVKTATDTHKLTQKLLLRMRLMEADLVVKAPKRNENQLGQLNPGSQQTFIHESFAQG